MDGQRGAIFVGALAYIVGCGFLLAGTAVRRSTVSLPQGEQADTIALLRAEVATLKRHHRIERGVCAVVSGFTLWRFVK